MIILAINEGAVHDTIDCDISKKIYDGVKALHLTQHKNRLLQRCSYQPVT